MKTVNRHPLPFLLSRLDRKYLVQVWMSCCVPKSLRNSLKLSAQKFACHINFLVDFFSLMRFVGDGRRKDALRSGRVLLTRQQICLKVELNEKIQKARIITINHPSIILSSSREKGAKFPPRNCHGPDSEQAAARAASGMHSTSPDNRIISNNPRPFKVAGRSAVAVTKQARIRPGPPAPITQTSSWRPQAQD